MCVVELSSPINHLISINKYFYYFSKESESFLQPGLKYRMCVCASVYRMLSSDQIPHRN